MRAYLEAAALLILATGLTVGLVIYLVADDEPVHAAIYEMSLFDDYAQWFAGLWRGKSLGATIAFLSVGASLCVFALSRRIK